MSSLIEGKWNHAVTSSMDRTIKVWDLASMVEDVFPLSRQHNQIMEILPCETLGVAVTRQGGHFLLVQIHRGTAL